MDTPKTRISGTIHVPKVRREPLQTQTGVKFTLAARSRNDELAFVRPENRVWSMKH